MMKVVFPFMLEVGILWQTGSIYPSHEHFASNIIKQKLYVAVDGNVGRYTQYRKRFLLFLPEREQHSLGLMFANFIIRSRGHEVLYLGQEIPLNDLKTTFAGHLPDYIFTILTAAHLDIEKQEFVNELSAYWKDSKILLSGSQFLMADIHYPQNVTLIKRMEEFIQLVNNLSEIATVN
jgi:methanogenic corrinoid protein MtbC1